MQKIRLSKQEINCIKYSTYRLDPEAKIYLFGSRTDPNKKGGDIDILIVSQKISRKDLRKIRISFYKNFGEQKIDIVLDNNTSNDPFIQLIKQEAIPL